MRVCVLTNVYNAASVIRDYLDSLVAQTYKDFELFIVDDGSTDNTMEIVNEYQDVLNTRILSLPHVGLNAARAEGVRNASADICIILDADEILEPPVIERFAAPFADPKVGAVGGRLVALGEGWVVRGTQIMREAVFRLRKARVNSDEAWVISGGCLAVRPDVVNELGGFTSEDGVADDYDVCWRLRSAGWRLLALEDIVVHHREPTTLKAVFRRKRDAGMHAVRTFGKHKRMLLDWRSIGALYPLGILILGFFKPLAALAAIIGTLLAALILFWPAQGSLVEKFYGWVLLNAYSIAYTVGFFTELIRMIMRRPSVARR